MELYGKMAVESVCEIVTRLSELDEVETRFLNVDLVVPKLD